MLYPIIEEIEGIEITAEIEELINKICRQVAEEEAINGEYEVNIIFVDDPFIQNLNSRFRGKDCPTDVLSFPFDTPEFLGEVYISLETAKRQAEEYNHTLTREIAFLTVHGLLHLLGYDHNDQPNELMREKEEKILSSLGIVRG
ncbi:rRNA maturation RNase YbeY [Anaerobranca gottschalkii]|uniref:Endoribonuclease YbeY n=1 Tax=Anaerobranca gottschalkii DSM 13577 TaxID=1120990 RepID=A0A1H9YDD0_9FIRM|nr:rRNA maturation RNase YbeY [Anaerobranca gottschalkii]SES66828.1 probable rRNA maturation factor [Anaerobranca gottschalkii DSM 13577]